MLTDTEMLWLRRESDADEQAADTPQLRIPADQVMVGEWMGRAACRTADPDLFHPAYGTPSVVAEAQAFCARCPVVAACRAFRYNSGSSGVWGGVYYGTSSDGVRIGRRKCALMRCTEQVRNGSPYCSIECEHKAKVGSSAGYDVHIKAKTKPCEPCALAHFMKSGRISRVRARHADA